MFLHDGGMPSEYANDLVKAVISVLKNRRLERLFPDRRGGSTKKPMSIGRLADEAGLDKSSLKRAEDGDRTPSLGFYVDWSKALGTTMEEVLEEARDQIDKDSKPDE